MVMNYHCIRKTTYQSIQTITNELFGSPSKLIDYIITNHFKNQGVQISGPSAYLQKINL